MNVLHQLGPNYGYETLIDNRKVTYKDSKPFPFGQPVSKRR